MLNAGVPATEVARRLEHSVATLLKRYATASMARSRPLTTGSHGRWRMAVCETLGADVGLLKLGAWRRGCGPVTDQRAQASHDPGVTAARRVRLVADGGGLENR